VKDLKIEGLELAALAKDRETGDPLSERLEKKGERVFVPGAKDPVAIRPGTAGLFLLMRVRDEAHRFAIGYHRQTRARRTFQSELDEIPGVGPTRRRTLLSAFGSVRAVRSASEAEIAAVVGPTTAARIRAHFDRPSRTAV
jgi:excinuclease ABC subunit C